MRRPTLQPTPKVEETKPAPGYRRPSRFVEQLAEFAETGTVTTPSAEQEELPAFLRDEPLPDPKPPTDKPVGWRNRRRS